MLTGPDFRKGITPDESKLAVAYRTPVWVRREGIRQAYIIWNLLVIERKAMAKLDAALQHLRSERERAVRELRQVEEAISALIHLGRNGASRGTSPGRRRRRKMSAAGRARIAAAQRARWAKTRRRSRAPKRSLSQKARNRIAAAQRARWAKVKAEQEQAKKAA